MPGVTESYRNDKQVLSATFDTRDGAKQAVKKLEELEKQGLLDVENTITVNKDDRGKIHVHQTTGDSGRKGAKIGALAGGVLGVIFPPSLLATAGLGAALGSMTGIMRGSQFDSADIKTMADEVQPGQSMLVTVVDPHWKEEVEAALDGMAAKIRWVVMTAAVAEALAQHDQDS